MIDNRLNYNSFKNSLYNELEKHLKEKTDIMDKYGCKLSSSQILKKYPRIVFTQNRMAPTRTTLGNEMIVKSVELEANIYAVDTTINGEDYLADEIIEHIAGELVYFFEKICRFKNVDLVTNLINFDDKDTQSQRARIMISTNWLQELNIKY